MKKIYSILTHTGTALSKIIKGFTKDEFSHVSIALDIELKEMYSFGRLNPYYQSPKVNVTELIRNNLLMYTSKKEGII